MSTIAAALLAAALACISSIARAADLYAQIEFVEGSVKVIDASGAMRQGRVGDAVFVGETIATGANGEIHARTADHGLVALRPGTQLRIEAFRATGGGDDTSVVSLLKGTLRSITGWIGKHRPQAYSIHTPTATIGIRGTDHEPMYLDEATREAPAGTYEKVNSGATFVEALGRRVEVPAGGAAHAPLGEAPRLLERVPNIYKPTGNESRIAHRKEELAREVEAMRVKAQKLAEEQRNKAQAEAAQHGGKSDGKAAPAGSDSATSAKSPAERSATEKSSPENSAADRQSAGKPADEASPEREREEHRRQRRHKHPPH